MSNAHPDQVHILYMDREQILALASASCNEVFSTLGSSEPLSAREVAQAIDRSPAAVGEQIAKLVDVGLVIPAGTRKRRSRTETLYVHKGVITRFSLKGQSKEALEAYQRRFSGQLRLAERQFEAFTDALEADPDFLDFLIYKTYNAQLDRASALRIQIAIGELLELLKSLDEEDSEVRAKGDFVRISFSALMLPTQQESQRRAQSSPPTTKPKGPKP